jgi:hypothetical protein
MFGPLRSVAFVPGFFVSLGAAAAMLAACGGRGFSPAPVSSASTTTVLNGGTGSAQTVTLPSAGGYAGSMILTFAQPASGVTADLSIGPSPPAGAPVPTSTDQPLVFVGLSVSSNVTLSGIPALVLRIPDSELQNIRRAQSDDDFDLLLDFFDPNNPSAGYQSGGACSLNGDTATCTGSSNALFNLLASLQYIFECKRHNHVPTPSPSPTATGSPAGGTTVIVVPTPAAIVCSPSSVVVAVKGTAIIDCTAQGYGGKFTATVANPAIASVQQSDSLTFTYFTVTGLSAGTTTITFRSQPGGSGSVSITVEQ